MSRQMGMKPLRQAGPLNFRQKGIGNHMETPPANGNSEVQVLVCVLDQVHKQVQIQVQVQGQGQLQFCDGLQCLELLQHRLWRLRCC